MKTFKKTKLNDRAVILLIIALLITGIGLFGNTLYIHAKAQLAQMLIKQAWEETIDKNLKSKQLNQPVKPWSWADTFPVAQLVVPSHQVNQFVLLGASGSPLAFGPGLYSGTLLPGSTKSQQPDSVIAGHHNTHFSFLKNMKLADQFHIKTFSGEKIHYRVNHIKVYDINQNQLPINYNHNTIKLVTCLPSYLGETHPKKRLVINAIQINHTAI